MSKELTDLENAKNQAYAERDRLVAALSKLFPATLERHPTEEQWDDDWRWIVFIELPAGQAAWHIHDSELPMFDHLPRETGLKWDGHSTAEKYERLAALESRFIHVNDLRVGQELVYEGESFIIENIRPYGETDFFVGLHKKDNKNYFKGTLLSVINKEKAHG